MQSTCATFVIYLSIAIDVLSTSALERVFCWLVFENSKSSKIFNKVFVLQYKYN